MKGHRTVPVLWCLSAAALFGASTPASKWLLGGMGPLTLAGLLYLGAALAVLPFSFRGGSRELAAVDDKHVNRIEQRRRKVRCRRRIEDDDALRYARGRQHSIHRNLELE